MSIRALSHELAVAAVYSSNDLQEVSAVQLYDLSLSSPVERLPGVVSVQQVEARIASEVYWHLPAEVNYAS